MRRKCSLGLSVQSDQGGPVSEGHSKSSDPGVQLPVVSQQTTCLKSVKIVETEFTRHVVVGRELDGGDLGCELVRD